MSVKPADGNGFSAGDAEACPRIALHERERNDAHADQIGAVNALERFCDDGAGAEQVGALGRPVTR